MSRTVELAMKPLAHVTHVVGGKFCRFHPGDPVKVLHDDGTHCLIERCQWDGSPVPLCNQLAGVPRKFLRFP